MIGEKSREPTFTRKVSHDDFHHGSISLQEVRERKLPLYFILVPRFDVWLKVMLLQVFFLEPFFLHILDSSGS